MEKCGLFKGFGYF